MIVCHCAAVTDEELRRVIGEGAKTFGQIARRCGAGRNCGPCRAEIGRLLYDAACSGQNPEHEEPEAGRRAA